MVRTQVVRKIDLDDTGLDLSVVEEDPKPKVSKSTQTENLEIPPKTILNNGLVQPPGTISSTNALVSPQLLAAAWSRRPFRKPIFPRSPFSRSVRKCRLLVCLPPWSSRGDFELDATVVFLE